MEAEEALVRRHVGGMKGREVANALWAYATLARALLPAVATALDAAMQCEAGHLNPQNVVNTLWAYATLATSPPPPQLLDSALLRSVVTRTPLIATIIFVSCTRFTSPPTAWEPRFCQRMAANCNLRDAVRAPRRAPRRPDAGSRPTRRAGMSS